MKTEKYYEATLGRVNSKVKSTGQIVFYRRHIILSEYVIKVLTAHVTDKKTSREFVEFIFRVVRRNNCFIPFRLQPNAKQVRKVYNY